MQDSALHPVLPCENSQRTKKQTGVRGCGKTREQTAPWRGAAPYLVARKFSANRAVAVMPRFREFFSSLVEPAALIHARSRLASFHICARQLSWCRLGREQAGRLLLVSTVWIVHSRRWLVSVDSCACAMPDFRQAKVSAGARTILMVNRGQ